ncbi:MAG: ATP-dependent DNA helicase UvrD2 [Acidimicrobiales bacterium]
MTLPGPPDLGRGVVVFPGQDPPALWAGARRIVVDDEALAAPADSVATLHFAWSRREPVVVELACEPATLREPETSTRPVWSLGPSFELERERLQFLVWANTYDARAGEPVWWHGRRAERLLADHAVRVGGPADVLRGDGTPLYVDGGPFPPPAVAGAEVVHRWSAEAGDLRLVGHGPSRAPLADDQRAAVEHGSGPARVIAPAGSGKTRVLTERLTHLLRDRGASPSSVMAVAFNDKAAEELRTRTGLSKSGDGAQVRTLNSLGLWICTDFGRRRLDVLGDESQVRELVQKVFDVRRQANADTVLPYIDALSAVRLGLRPPTEVEDAVPDAAGLAERFDGYRAALRDMGALDYDEQIYRAIEILLADPDARREAQSRCRMMLVDEFQDLNPAHLLLIRLLCAPAFDCFGVGDDDQVIYGYSGATPEFLIEFGRYFPSAGEHALEVNYRCPPAVVSAAANLLSYNTERIAKSTRPGPGRDDTLPGFAEPLRAMGPVAVQHGSADTLPKLARDVLGAWTAAAVAHEDMAVLARVNSVLLPVQVELTAAGVPCSRPLGPKVLDRTGIRAALAYLRMGLAPEAINRRDVELTVRRPTRGIARNVVEMLLEKPVTSLGAIRGLAKRLSGNDGPKVAEYADAIAYVAGRCGVSTVEALRAIRLEVGLATTMDVLDSSRREADRSTHVDDLVALESVASLHPEVDGFETWLRAQLNTPAPQGPVVLLSTIHRIKGREWDYVVVYGASKGVMPHRLSEDEEGERRVFHVAITRARRQVVVLADSGAPSPFVDELTGSRPRVPVSGHRRETTPPALRERRPATRTARKERRHDPPPASVVAAIGLEIEHLGHRGAITELKDASVVMRVGSANLGVPYGTSVTIAGKRLELAPPGRNVTDPDALEGALRTWRSEAARRAGVSAFVVLHDAHLRSIVEHHPRSLAELARCKGMGPTKLERWGDEILSVLATAGEGTDD